MTERSVSELSRGVCTELEEDRGMAYAVCTYADGEWRVTVRWPADVMRPPRGTDVRLRLVEHYSGEVLHDGPLPDILAHRREADGVYWLDRVPLPVKRKPTTGVYTAWWVHGRALTRVALLIKEPSSRAPSTGSNRAGVQRLE